ncbi:hypothetical protein GQ457_10G019980 [Hibiscus cannabinus]
MVWRAHDYPTSGVFEVERPRRCLGFKFRKSVFMGTTYLDPARLRDFMERQSASYNGDTYHLIFKNCKHFCEDIYMLQTDWEPDVKMATAVHHDRNFQSDDEKKRLRSTFSCLWSISSLRGKYQWLHSFYTLTIKTVYHHGN